MPKLTLKEAKERFKKYGATMLDDVYINNATKYNLCVEYDGQQHFDEIHAYSKESFQQTKINDEIKTNYCKENNILLLRIPYWEFNNIEKILENTLASIIKNFND